MSIQNTKNIIEIELKKIVDLFQITLDSFYSRTEFIDQIKVEPIDEHIPTEVTPLNSELFSEKLVPSTSKDNKEKSIFCILSLYEKSRITV